MVLYSAFFYLKKMSEFDKIAVLHVAKYMDGNDRLCKHNCLFCMERFDPKQSAKRLPSLEYIETILAKYFSGSSDFSKIYIAGGEPTLREDFPDLVRLVKNYCQDVVLSTSCDYDDVDSVVKQIFDLKIGQVATSIHSYKDEVHDSLTGSAGSFSRSLEAVHKLVKLGVPVTVNSVINAFNVRDLSRIVDMFLNLEIDIRKLTLTHYMRHGNAYYHDELRFNVDDYADSISKALDSAEKVPYNVCFRDFPICLDLRLLYYREIIDNMYILGVELSDESAPFLAKDKCKQCALSGYCSKYLLSNYGE